MVTPRVRPVGERAFLLEVGTLDEVLPLHASLTASRPDGVIDLVPAARTVLVRVDPRVLPAAAARSWALGAATETRQATDAATPPVELDIAYDGADLADTARLLGVDAHELARRHAQAHWRVAFTGFAPGFGYLVSDDWTFDVPRLESPRTRVPAGSVGLAGVFSGAYPRETPGGWRLIGTTAARLFDPDAPSPALLEPGARVRFRPVPARVSAESGDLARTGRFAPDAPAFAGSPDLAEGARRAAAGRSIRVVEAGLLTTVQDLGRAGAASVGVAVSGALDRGALRTANRLVGNSEGAAGLEVTMGGLRAVAEADLWVAVTGAWGTVRLDGREVDPYEAHEWRAGSELHLDWFAHGARGYVAVRGGLDARVALGSRATDLLAGLGPAALRAGDVVGVRDDVAGPIPVAPAAGWGAPQDGELALELAPGPRADWFAPAALATLYETVWTVSNHADRVGARLDGPELARVRSSELPSEGMVPGALQVPPSGRPTILLADGPVTGGYPVIAVVTDAGLDLVAQARPGTRIRFRHARPAG
ncbi:KipI family sensor histidine kinase inhibitor [Microbacterium sp. BE35]|uniref:5-oxoprolinase subunit B/C family protein n=1 Tax=Microbacterium sp. BE35 TaxID=2817773 RepID=UPI0028667280|nr:urea amidolyase family protein [Microbacterium sp. BE35]MDR7188621.1 KipI family sensor histidine kinase inhibitor [Microbacterium sp. BE35]